MRLERLIVHPVGCLEAGARLAEHQHPRCFFNEEKRNGIRKLFAKLLKHLVHLNNNGCRKLLVGKYEEENRHQVG